MGEANEEMNDDVYPEEEEEELVMGQRGSCVNELERERRSEGSLLERTNKGGEGELSEVTAGLAGPPWPKEENCSEEEPRSPPSPGKGAKESLEAGVIEPGTPARN